MKKKNLKSIVQISTVKGIYSSEILTTALCSDSSVWVKSRVNDKYEEWECINEGSGLEIKAD